MATVLCLRWGDLYSSNDVNLLYSMVKRHTRQKDLRFVCLTNHPEGLAEGIEHFPIPKIPIPKSAPFQGWKKLTALINPLYNIKGKVLCLDLDIVIIDNIDCFFKPDGDFYIIENWTQRGRGIGNSSVYRFEAGKQAHVLDAYINDPEAAAKNFHNEQTFLSKHARGLNYWNEAWVKSFKHQCIPPTPLNWFVEPKKPIGTKIVAFHGHPKPIHAADGVWLKRFRRVLPTSWIRENYKLAD